LCLTPLAEGFPWDDLREIFSGCQRMANVPSIGPKLLYIWLPLLCLIPPQWSGSLHHIIVGDISLKLGTLGCMSVVERLGISPTTFTQCAPKAIEFDEITQNNGHYAVPGQSRSPILVPIESS